MIQARGDEPEIVHSMLHPDEMRIFLADPVQRIQRYRHGGPAGDVIDHPRLFGQFGDLSVIGDQTPLRRADVVGCHDQQRVCPRLVGMCGQGLRLGKALRARGGDDRHLAGGGLDRDVDRPVAFLNGQCRRFGRGPVDQNAMRAVLDLKFHQPRIGIVIDLAVLERRDQGRDGAFQEILGQTHHFGQLAALVRLVSKPVSAPSTLQGFLRSSCQSRDSMMMLSG